MSKPHKKAKGPQVITANRLIDGDVVYWRDEDTWVDTLSEAKVLESAEEVAAAQAHAENHVREDRVVDPYTFGVDVREAAVSPISMRELIRAKGPTVRLDLGKQAEGV